MKKNKTDLSDLGISRDQLKQILNLLDLWNTPRILGYKGILTYKRLHPPMVKNATVGDIQYVIAKQRHRETKKYWYHWEATYIFSGKDWVCCSKHERPEDKTTVAQLEKIEKMKRDSAMSSREAASCGFMRMMAL